MFNRPTYGAWPASQVQPALQLVADTFGLAWLETAGPNALQRLWARGDHTSTLELVALATSLKVLRPLDAAWLKSQVKLAKSPNAGAARGALFEIFALSMLHAPATQRIMPAKMNQAGYDGLLTGSDGKQLRVSIKHYGGSRHEREFEEHARAVEQQLLPLLQQSAYPPCQVVLDFPSRYPTEREWQLLRDSLPDWFRQHQTEPLAQYSAVEPLDPTKPLSRDNSRALFVFMLGRLNAQQLRDFHPAYTSYSFLASSVYHPNEVLNFYSKLDEGCANLSRHAAVETPEVANVLFVHLPDTVTLAQAEQWVLSYYAEKPHKPVSGVFLYQPSIVENQDHNSVLTNAFKVCLKPEGMMATHFRQPYELVVPVGHVGTESPTNTLRALVGGQQSDVLTVTDRYLYQQGHHYHRMQVREGSLVGNMSSRAGVHTHMVMDTQQLHRELGIAPGEGPSLFTIQQRHPQVERLLIM